MTATGGADPAKRLVVDSRPTSRTRKPGSGRWGRHGTTRDGLRVWHHERVRMWIEVCGIAQVGLIIILVVVGTALVVVPAIAGLWVSVAVTALILAISSSLAVASRVEVACSDVVPWALRVGEILGLAVVEVLLVE